MKTQNGSTNNIIMYRCSMTYFKGSVCPSTSILFCPGDCLNNKTSCGVIILFCLFVLSCTYKLYLKLYKCNFGPAHHQELHTDYATISQQIRIHTSIENIFFAIANNHAKFCSKQKQRKSIHIALFSLVWTAGN